jgi:hypothetical protein
VKRKKRIREKLDGHEYSNICRGVLEVAKETE